MPSLSDPLITDKIELKNRIVMPPMANDLSSTPGAVTGRHTEHYNARSPADDGLSTVAHSSTFPQGELSSNP